MSSNNKAPYRGLGWMGGNPREIRIHTMLDEIDFQRAKTVVTTINQATLHQHWAIVCQNLVTLVDMLKVIARLKRIWGQDVLGVSASGNALMGALNNLLASARTYLDYTDNSLKRAFVPNLLA